MKFNIYSDKNSFWHTDDLTEVEKWMMQKKVQKQTIARCVLCPILIRLNRIHNRHTGQKRGTGRRETCQRMRFTQSSSFFFCALQCYKAPT